MQTIELRAEPRTVTGKKVRRLRREGLVPANIYGHGDSRPIQAPARVLEHLLAHGGRNALLNVVFDGGAQTALVKHVSRDPRSGGLLHIDLQAVSLNERVATSVPVHFVGESVAVTRMDGVLLHPLTEVKVEALARNLPEGITVDLGVLTELGSAIHVSDLEIPEGVTLLTPGDELVALVQAPKVEVEEVTEEAAAEAAPSEEGAAATTETESPSEAGTAATDES